MRLIHRASEIESIERLSLRGEDINLAVEATGPAAGPPVLFLHGSGQTRQSWRQALLEGARRGFRSFSPDLRGHGESDWSPDGAYTIDLFTADARRMVEQIGGEPILVGASIGALVSLLVGASPPPLIRAVVLVDISPTPGAAGVQEVVSFMGGAQDGFASIEEAADAVAAYLPHRTRPKDSSGLAKNLRLRNGRYHWHWDPAFFAKMAGDPGHVDRAVNCMKAAARTLRIPTLMIRGGSSRVVTKAGARAFLDMVPHAEFADIAGAHHMVPGDANDAFNGTVFEFLQRQVGRTADGGTP
jgi:pimeloyl-ACP methyl ester carboxylesterase